MADIVFEGQAAAGTLGLGFLPQNYDLVLYKGDYFPLRATIHNSGVPLNLTGYTAKASVRPSYDSEEEFLFTTTITAGSGIVDLVLPSSVSSTLSAGDYVWDFQLTNPDGNVRTYIAGDVHVYDEVTR